jgi:hypothetical protein
MNPNHDDEMSREYELHPGQGVRGKPYDSYVQGASVNLIVVEGAAYVAVPSSSAPAIGIVTSTELSPFEIILAAPVHAG